MAIFYLLPPRPLLGDRLALFLQHIFPGLDWDCAGRQALTETLGYAAEARGVFVVYREDLPPGELPVRALIDGYGAEAGDEVVEVRPGGGTEGLTARRWRISPDDKVTR